MRVYLGQTRSRKLIMRLNELGFGEMCQPREWPPRRYPFALDNAAFSAWRSGQPFDSAGFLRACGQVVEDGRLPDFVVCPDLVASGLDSLAFSLEWLDSYASAFPALRWRLAVQDGMVTSDVDPHLQRFSGIFVGGTMPWKLARGSYWVDYAHAHGLECHIGRVGTEDTARWARRIGADSIDSCTPLWGEANLARFLRGLELDPPQRSWC